MWKKNCPSIINLMENNGPQNWCFIYPWELWKVIPWCHTTVQLLEPWVKPNCWRKSVVKSHLWRDMGSKRCRLWPLSDYIMRDASYHVNIASSVYHSWVHMGSLHFLQVTARVSFKYSGFLPHRRDMRACWLIDLCKFAVDEKVV